MDQEKEIVLFIGDIYKEDDDDKIIYCDPCTISLLRDGVRVYGDITLPFKLYRKFASKILLLVYIHNNRKLYTVKDLEYLLKIIEFEYTSSNRDTAAKQYHIKTILGEDHNEFIEFINSLIVGLINIYNESEDSVIEYGLSYLPNWYDDLRFTDGLNIIHSTIMRVICSIIMTDIDLYDKYVNNMLPMSSIHKLHLDPVFITKYTGLFGDDVLISDESNIFNTLIVHHAFVNLCTIMNDIVYDILFDKTIAKIVDKVPVLKQEFDDYKYINSISDTVGFIANKLLNLNDSEKVMFNLTGELMNYMNVISEKDKNNKVLFN